MTLNALSATGLILLINHTYIDEVEEVLATNPT